MVESRIYSRFLYGALQFLTRFQLVKEVDWSSRGAGAECAVFPLGGRCNRPGTRGLCLGDTAAFW